MKAALVTQRLLKHPTSDHASRHGMAKLVSEETGHIRATASCLQEKMGGPESGRLYQSTAPPFSSHVTRQIMELFLVFSPEPGAAAGAYGIDIL